MGADTVFTSYSHDSPEHSERVLAFSNKLREQGVDAELDQYITRPSQGWPQWCEEQLRPQNSKFVLLICTETYRNRVENRVPADEGRGVYWEGGIVCNYIYKAKANERFLPVLFGDESDESIPIALQGFAKFRIRAFDLSDPGFEALYRELTVQPAVIKQVLGEKVVLGTKTPAATLAVAPLAVKPALTTFAAPDPPPVDISRIDRYAPAELIGREAEMALIEEAWAKAVAGEAHPRVLTLTFVALGGEGKTALVAKWAIGRSDNDWPGCEAAFAWSFYSQGTSDQQTASSDLFLAEGLKFFGAPAVEGVESGHDKGRRLAKWIGERRAALILDGLEPLQYAPTAPTPGELKDQGLRALLTGLAQHNKGLCLVTTRYRIKDLEPYAATAPQHDLVPLSKEAGAKLLERLGVKGTLKERETLTEDVKGHALTLNLVGSYLRAAFHGDVRKYRLLSLSAADRKLGRNHASHVMDAYVRWLEDTEDGPRALATLRLLGLFDRPANAGCLEALWRAPEIEGLTEPLVALTDEDRELALTQLADAKLVTVNRDPGGALVSLDAHPLLRQYFAKDLRETRPKAWTAAHGRLYEHLTETTLDKPEPTLDDLQPLYQAVAHGCHAGMQQEACEKVYRDRILRGMGSGGYYSTQKLGAYGADLGAVACFFDAPWRQASRNLSPPAQSWMLGQAAFRLRALGRLTEAQEPMRACLATNVEREDWPNAGISASNLSELDLTLGEVGAAIRDGESSVTYAERRGSGFHLNSNITTHADALHQAGRRAEAEGRFAEAEAMQAVMQHEYPLLYSTAGFSYCELLLANAERAAWRQQFAAPELASHVEPDTAQAPSRGVGAPQSISDDASDDSERLIKACRSVSRRAAQTLDWAKGVTNVHLLDIGLNHLTLARAALYQAILHGERPSGTNLKEAMDLLRRAGAQEFIPRGLLTRTLWCAATGDFDGAREDLDEASEIAERGPMRLFLADIHLHRARLFGLMAGRPKDYPWISARDDLDAARKLIETCGYGRRREELEDAEAAWERIYGTAAPAGSPPA